MATALDLNRKVQTVPEKALWIDLQNPAQEDLAALKTKFGFHNVILRELEVPSVRARLEIYENYLFFIYNFPLYNPFEQTCRRAEIDFLITPTALITVHYEPLPPLADMQNFSAATPFDLLYSILLGIFRFEERQLHHIREKVESVGDGLFTDKEKEVLRQISFVKRDSSEYRVIVRAGENVLHSLRERGPAVWGEGSRVYLNDLVAEHSKIVSQIEDYRETLNDFERTNSQLMYSKTTEVMKRLTAFSFLTFPFMLIAAIFAMQVEGNPLSGRPEGFWIIVGAIVIGIITLSIFFKRRDWL